MADAHPAIGNRGTHRSAASQPHRSGTDDSRCDGQSAGLCRLTGSEPHSAYEGRKAGAGSRIYRMERRVPGARNDTHGRLAGRLETLPCR